MTPVGPLVGLMRSWCDSGMKSHRSDLQTHRLLSTLFPLDLTAKKKNQGTNKDDDFSLFYKCIPTRKYLMHVALN